MYYNEPINVKVTNFNWQSFWLVVGITSIVLVGILLYFTLFNKKNNYDKGVMKVLNDIVHFKYFYINDILKILYIILVLMIIIISLRFIGKWQFLVILIGGNLGLRIIFELIMLFVDLCNNVKVIASKTKK